jgi:CubicO group peptidase (beta-lactamase class C family)
MAIMKLVEMGKLNLYDAAATHMPEMKSLVYLTKDATPITIENLLTMTAGFPEDNPWGDRQLEDTPEELQTLVAEGLSFSNIPAFSYEYSNTGFAILGQIISNVSGQPYQEFINENIFKPLGMNNTYWEFEGLPEDLLALGYRWEDEQWKPEPLLHDGAFGCMGGLITSLEDFSKYVAYHLSAYPPKNDDEYGPVKRSSLRRMHKPLEPSLMANAKDADGNPCPVVSGYGYGLSARKDCNGVVYIRHSGGLPGFGSDYRFYPEYDLGIISFANRTYAGTGSINNDVAHLIFKKAGLQPRVLPASDVLLKAQNEVSTWLQTHDSSIEEALFAENFFLDFSKERRIREYDQVLDQIGPVTSVTAIRAMNQLRGAFTLVGEKGNAEVFFTMSPEKTPKVQQLDVWLKE